MTVAPQVAIRSMRRCFAELRKQLPKSTKLRDTALTRLTLSTARKHQATDERLCHQRNELVSRLDTFTAYLESNRRVAEIQKMYHNKGERSVKEAANLVGLELPNVK
ncbi:protein FMC1 homolog [Galendromus occidentalis]|uniref:Protein FMC1 homolog n=1 Tax=Galendromus occidentalis TaxID=34638 RepID=A0AAJ6VWW7_9ACAR|nr:protein FMC1 homolog [Galendromus occidentalis]